MELYDHQKKIAQEAVQVINESGMVYLVMELRTGKTLTSLEICTLMGVKKVLFVSKKIAIASIENDYANFRYFDDFALTTINFASLHKVEGDFDLVIVDEAHNLGAFPKPSKRAKQLKKIAFDLPIIYLSGTPTPESYSQIYHQFYISKNSPFHEWGSFYKWAKGFVTVKDKYFFNRRINDYSDADKNRIDEMTKHLFISYTQKEAGFENEIIEKIHQVKMKKSTYKVINLLKRKRVVEGKSGVVLGDTAVKMMLKIHQLCSGSVKDEDGNIHQIDDSKVKYIEENFKGKKIAIFYKYQGEGMMLKNHFEDRFTMSPEHFNEEKDLVFIRQIQSGREGVNLSTADDLIMFNIDFSALSYLQGKERIQSKTRTKKATVHWLFSENGIEKDIYKVVLSKKNYTLSYFKKTFL